MGEKDYVMLWQAKMIINTGMRTDIPAFYSEWFINRIKEGYVWFVIHIILIRLRGIILILRW